MYAILTDSGWCDVPSLFFVFVQLFVIFWVKIKRLKG